MRTSLLRREAPVYQQPCMGTGPVSPRLHLQTMLGDGAGHSTVTERWSQDRRWPKHCNEQARLMRRMWVAPPRVVPWSGGQGKDCSSPHGECRHSGEIAEQGPQATFCPIPAEWRLRRNPGTHREGQAAVARESRVASVSQPHCGRARRPQVCRLAGPWPRGGAEGLTSGPTQKHITEGTHFRDVHAACCHLVLFFCSNTRRDGTPGERGCRRELVRNPMEVKRGGMVPFSCQEGPPCTRCPGAHLPCDPAKPRGAVTPASEGPGLDEPRPPTQGHMGTHGYTWGHFHFFGFCSKL